MSIENGNGASYIGISYLFKSNCLKEQMVKEQIIKNKIMIMLEELGYKRFYIMDERFINDLNALTAFTESKQP